MLRIASRPERIPMSQVDEPTIDLQRTLASLYSGIGPELRRVDARLSAELHSDHSEADAVIRHGIRLAGKRLRPALLLLAGRAVGPLRDEHITLAAVVEMIHTATLVHDDVLDEAAIRRHVDTVNARWNNETSVLLGDFLFTHAFYLASTLQSTYACRTIGRATNIVCDGELRQTLASGDVHLTDDDYLAIVEAKTAELCACCCELGAHYAGGDRETVARLAAFGRSLGIAFQIADDLLDLEGNEAATGKSLGTDLAKRKMTLPLIHARDSLAPQERKLFLTALAGIAVSSEHGVWSADQLPAPCSPLPASVLRAWLARHDSLGYARAQAQAYADRAQSQLDSLPDGPARDALAALAEFAVARRA
jgi:octaprenyl-diphosphate synthase